jgi:hypothetical protein
MTNSPKPVAAFASGARLGGILPFVLGKRGYRRSEIVKNQLSGFTTSQELEISGIKLLFRYDQCYRFIDISRYFSSDNRRRGPETTS